MSHLRSAALSDFGLKSNVLSFQSKNFHLNVQELSSQCPRTQFSLSNDFHLKVQ